MRLWVGLIFRNCEDMEAVLCQRDLNTWNLEMLAVVMFLIKNQTTCNRLQMHENQIPHVKLETYSESGNY
jgi:hypothetical protein